MRVIIVQLRGQQKRRHQILLKQFKLIFFQLIPINLLCQILDSINLWFAPSHIKHHFPTRGHGTETRGDHHNPTAQSFLARFYCIKCCKFLTAAKRKYNITKHKSSQQIYSIVLVANFRKSENNSTKVTAKTSL